MPDPYEELHQPITAHSFYVAPIDHDPAVDGWEEVGRMSPLNFIDTPTVDADSEWFRPAQVERVTLGVITFDIRNVDLEDMELIVGVPLVQLCNRRIPAEGVE